MPNAADRADLVDELLAGYQLIKVQSERTMKQAANKDMVDQKLMLLKALSQAVKDCDYYIGLGNRT